MSKISRQSRTSSDLVTIAQLLQVVIDLLETEPGIQALAAPEGSMPYDSFARYWELNSAYISSLFSDANEFIQHVIHKYVMQQLQAAYFGMDVVTQTAFTAGLYALIRENNSILFATLKRLHPTSLRDIEQKFMSLTA